MTTEDAQALTPVSRATALVPADALESAKGYARAAKSERTRRAYRWAWRDFQGWCDEHGLTPLPALPETVVAYLSQRADAGKKVATLELLLAAVSQAHQVAGVESPRSSAVVRDVMKGIRRERGVAPTQKAPILAAELRQMVSCLPDTLAGTRDRALLLLGFAGAFRRSELAALEVTDLEFTQDGLEVTLRRSKTDPEGKGRKIGVPFGSSPTTCPVRAVRAWLAGAGIEAGPVLRAVDRHGCVGEKRLSGHAIAEVVKRVAEKAGIDRSSVSGHSLRAGLATSAAKAGKSERAIMAQTGHRSASMIPYEDLTPEPIDLPPRQTKTGYVRPPMADQTFVPKKY